MQPSPPAAQLRSSGHRKATVPGRVDALAPLPLVLGAPRDPQLDQLLSRARPLSSLPCPLTITRLRWLLSQPLERHTGMAAPREEAEGGMEIISF